jgi:uncharacterized protein YgbK (DUF1537 family)
MVSPTDHVRASLWHWLYGGTLAMVGRLDESIASMIEAMRQRGRTGHVPAGWYVGVVINASGFGRADLVRLAFAEVPPSVREQPLGELLAALVDAAEGQVERAAGRLAALAARGKSFDSDTHEAWVLDVIAAREPALASAATAFVCHRDDVGPGDRPWSFGRTR